MYDCVVTSILT